MHISAENQVCWAGKKPAKIDLTIISINVSLWIILGAPLDILNYMGTQEGFSIAE